MSLIDDYRPNNLDDMVGQEHLVGNNGMLRAMLTNKRLTSCIFYGPPGCGKTTAAWIAANTAGYPFLRLNATTASTKEIQTAVAKAQTNGETLVLCLDEIQYFNKKQQQILLSPIEDGTMILIAMTTENPYFSCIDALLSRCTVFEFKQLSVDDVLHNLTNVWNKAAVKYPAVKEMTQDALCAIAENAAGDIRRSLQLLDTAAMTFNGTITRDMIENMLPSNRTSRFDLGGDIHYNLIAALQKSIRGSDPNAAVFYLARLLEGGDILSPCRRLMVIANEDIGLADPDAVPFVYSCVQMAKELGMPEAALPLTNAVLRLALAPKCSTCETTYNAAAEDVRKGRGATVPAHINKGHPKNYVWPHQYPMHWCPQQYMPDDLVGTVYYVPQNNEFEQKAINRMQQTILQWNHFAQHTGDK